MGLSFAVLSFRFITYPRRVISCLVPVVDPDPRYYNTVVSWSLVHPQCTVFRVFQKRELRIEMEHPNLHRLGLQIGVLFFISKPSGKESSLCRID
jgi:hypothetical protein